MGHPPRSVALRIARRIAQSEGVACSDAMTTLIDAAPEAASVCVCRRGWRVWRGNRWRAGRRFAGARAA
jgi:hypothetical protein